MNTTLVIIQVIVSAFLILFIMLQKGGGGVGELFGGKGTTVYQTLRGAEKKIFWLTIVLGFLFIVLGLLNLLI
jgi:protein translocase SecG subunit